MRLSEVAAELGVEPPVYDCTFSSISTDTRSIRAGDLFIALKGENFDGHHYAQAALDAGAGGVLIERPINIGQRPHLLVPDTLRALGVISLMHRRGFSGRVIAVTGSCGKTTVKGMLREVLAGAGSVTATVGNLNNQIGVPLTLMQLDKQDFAVVELGTNSPGEIGYLAKLITPDVALVNNVAPAHIGGFANLAAIAEEKGAVYSTLTSDQTAVINGEDHFAGRFLADTAGSRQIVFATEGNAQPGVQVQLQASHIRIEDGLPVFELQWQQQSETVRLAVPGRHNVSNALAAAACALAVQCPVAAIAAGLARFSSEKGRMQLHTMGCFTLVNDTYNANPRSVSAAIDFLADQSGLTYLVIGDMAELGAHTEQAHRDVGRYARSRGISGLFTVGPNAALAAEEFGAKARSFADKFQLIEELKPKLAEQATLLVKGSRSARMEEVVDALRSAGVPQC